MKTFPYLCIIIKTKSIMAKSINFENITLRSELSYRGGGLEISLDTLGFKNEKMSAYQNYLGGGMLGRVQTNNTLRLRLNIKILFVWVHILMVVFDTRVMWLIHLLLWLLLMFWAKLKPKILVFWIAWLKLCIQAIVWYVVKRSQMPNLLSLDLDRYVEVVIKLNTLKYP